MPSYSFKSIYELCTDREDRPESELVMELKYILAANPEVAHETDPKDWNRTLLHYAARSRSKEFCKLLFQQNPEAVKITDDMGWLPFHTFWFYGEHGEKRIETIEYLYELYPESMDIADFQGNCPIHLYITRHSSWTFELLQFLLVHDRGALSKPDSFGLLPLHNMVSQRRNNTLDSIQLVYNAYPDAIYVKCRGATPWEFARFIGGPQRHMLFFTSQLDFIRHSKYNTTPDINGQLPIHRQLSNELLSSGTVKLMAKANPASLTTADVQGRIPLHIAIRHRDIDVVRHLIEANHLKISDKRGNCALHYACLAGKCDIINYLLEQSSHGVSSRNLDGKLPIQLLLYDAECDRDNLEYMGAVHRLLFAYPNVQDIALC